MQTRKNQHTFVSKNFNRGSHYIFPTIFMLLELVSLKHFFLRINILKCHDMSIQIYIKFDREKRRNSRTP